MHHYIDDFGGNDTFLQRRINQQTKQCVSHGMHLFLFVLKLSQNQIVMWNRMWDIFVSCFKVHALSSHLIKKYHTLYYFYFKYTT